MTQPIVRQGITETFQQFQSILEARDFDAFRSLVSADFAYTENGETFTLEQLVAREQQASKGQPDSEMQWEIKDIQLENGIATVQVEGSFTTHISAEGKRLLYEGQLSETAQLVKENDRWCFTSANLRVEEMTLDGQPVDADMLDQMHRVDVVEKTDDRIE